MGSLKRIKNATTAPLKSLENKLLPVVNSVNNYLDKWFPQEKWNWRKIAVAWAVIQVIIIGALQVYVAREHNKEIISFKQKASQGNHPEWNKQLSIADPLTVYQMIFLVAQFFQLYLICDTITKSSTIQLIVGTIFSIGISTYSFVQKSQAEKVKENKDVQTNIVNYETEVNKALLQEKLIIGLMIVFSLGWIIITLRLYKVFGWNVFKQLGADIGVKNRLKLYQIFISILKLDIFFFTSFAMQFLVFVVFYVDDDDKKSKIMKYSSIVLLVITFIMPFIGFSATKKENYRSMCVFLVFLSLSIGYIVYNFVDIKIDDHENAKMGCDENASGNSCYIRKYRDCSNSLSVACISSFFSGIITFILALINFKNFPKGLKKDKSIHPPASQNSTLSTSYNTPKRWSIE